MLLLYSMVLGLKGITHDLAYLSNDDIETPTNMCGKKVVPILELGCPGSEDHEVCAKNDCRAWYCRVLGSSSLGRVTYVHTRFHEDALRGRRSNTADP